MRALLVAIVVASTGGGVCAEPADHAAKSLETCFQTARETDPICSDPANDAAQRLDCFQRAHMALLQCMEQATAGGSAGFAAPDLATGNLSPPETSAGTSPAEKPDNPAPSGNPVRAAPPQRPAGVAEVPARPADAPAKQADVRAKQVEGPVEQAVVPAKPADLPAKPVDASTKPADVRAKQVEAPVEQAVVPAKPADLSAKPVDASTKLADAGWIVSETTSPVDFSPLITAVIRTNSGTGTLAIRCRGRRTELSVHSEGAWRSTRSGNIAVAYQINGQPPVKLVWAESTDGKTASYKEDAADLVRALPEGAWLNIRVFDNADSGHDASFQLTGLNAVRKRLATICNWTPANEISSGKP